MNVRFYQENLPQWQESIREIMEEPRVSRFLKEWDDQVSRYIESLSEEERSKIDLEETTDHKAGIYKKAEHLLPVQDESMRGYAKDWSDVSHGHADSELYKRIMGFFQPEDGLLVDLGCGAGFFLSEVPFESVIGVDINHYCLQAAEQVLSQNGRKPRRFSRSYISFDPNKGFIIKPYPIMQELNLQETNLIADDIETMQNTIRVLYNHGRKADMVTFMLHGGYTNKSPIQFLEMMKYDGLDEFLKKTKTDAPSEIVDEAVEKVGKICKPGGRLLLGVRSGFVYDGEKFRRGTPEIFGQDIADKHNNIDVVRAASIPMMQENGLSGIEVSRHFMGKDSEGIDLDEIKDEEYELYLIDARVR